MMTIAKRVRDIRYAKGWGPDELAHRAEISRTALYQIECGKTETPRAGTLKRIAKALDVSIETLMGHEEGGAFEVGRAAAVPAEPEAPATPPVEGAEAESPTLRTRDAVRRLSRAQEGELLRKFHELLASPASDSIARIIEESYRLLGPHRNGHTG
jgi:transcriptional regulator with XRE-family HTH domain